MLSGGSESKFLLAVIEIWDPEVDVPAIADLKVIPGIRYQVVTEAPTPKVSWRKREKGAAGFSVHIASGTKGSSGHHSARISSGENNGTEQARLCVSTDLGKTWSQDIIIDDPEGELASSHGVFYSAEGKLWAFHGAFFSSLRNKTHMRAFLYDEKNDTWLKKGQVLEGFWPMQEPIRMDNGKLIMAGIKIPFPAVAICDGDDLTQWSLKVLPISDALKKTKHWGECSVIVDGCNILLISRWNHDSWALASISSDYGETWSEVKKTNLPMAKHKPDAGTLSNGIKYLVNSNARDIKGRCPITITLARPGDDHFSKIMTIRNNTGKGHRPCGRISYPHAWEHEGHLYVTYACHKKWAELAVVPITNIIKLWPELNLTKKE